MPVRRKRFTWPEATAAVWSLSFEIARLDGRRLKLFNIHLTAFMHIIIIHKNLALPLPLAQRGASRRDLAIAVAEALFRYNIPGVAPRSLRGL